MTLCAASLESSFAASGLWNLYAAALALAGVFGWGGAVELLLRPRDAATSVAHAFLQGTVVVAVILLGGSLAGVPAAPWLAPSVAWCGVVIGTATLRPLLRRRPQAASPLPMWLVAPLGIAVAVAIVELVTRPMIPGDLTSIWAFHGKALACEPLFQSFYVREPVWAGTHPDYPLYLSLLHAYAFAISDSFRDDFVKAWQAVAFASMILVLVRATAQTSGRRLPAALVGTALLAMATLPQGGMLGGTVELNVMIFAALVAIGVASSDWERLPLYLFGLVFAKHESMVQAFALAGGLAVASLFVRIRIVRVLAPWLALTGAWLAVHVRLPALHENYPGRITSAAAWSEGIAGISTIAAGYVRILSHEVPATCVVLGIAGAIVVAMRRREWRTAWPSMLLLGAFFGMLAVYFLIYVISPFGPHLYEITLARLFLQIAPLAVIGCALATQPKRAHTIVLGVALAIFGSYAVQKYAKRAHERFVALRDGQIGRTAYQADEDWQRAFAIDAAVAPGARGALLGEERYFGWTFRLYPRLLYPAPPETLAGTWRPWVPWSVVSPEERERLRLTFVVEGGTLR